MVEEVKRAACPVCGSRRKKVFSSENGKLEDSSWADVICRGVGCGHQYVLEKKGG